MVSIFYVEKVPFIDIEVNLLNERINCLNAPDPHYENPPLSFFIFYFELITFFVHVLSHISVRRGSLCVLVIKN